ncbi:MAG: tetratricopeptide repeat protein [Bacteroidota bacterium]
MGKSLKFFLSLGLTMGLWACETKPQTLDGPSQEELRQEAEAVYDVIRTQFRQGSAKEMNQIQKALLIDTTYAEAWRELSVAYLKRGMPHKWKPYMDKAVEHDAKTWQPWRGYLYLWFYRDYRKAIADFNASDTLTPYIDHPQGHSVDYWRGIAYLGLKDYQNSIRYFDQHISHETEESGEDWVEINAFLYRGLAQLEQKDTVAAKKDFHKIIHYFKKSADAKYHLARIFHQQKQKDSALLMLSETIEDFEAGYSNSRPYVEALYQIYREDLANLEAEIAK